MKKLRIVTAHLTVLLGIVHVSCAPLFYHGLTLSALWYVGAGLALVFLGFMNVLLPSVEPKCATFAGAIVANAVALAFAGALAWVLRSPPALIAVVLTAILFVGALQRPARVAAGAGKGQS